MMGNQKDNAARAVEPLQAAPMFQISPISGSEIQIQ